MTLNGVTYAAAPNAKDTFAYDMRWYRTGATTPEPTVEWTFAHRNFEWRGTITDKYGIKDEPNFYGPNGFLAARSSQHGDVFWWNEDRMKLTLLAKGYWRTSSGGPAYVEGWYILTPRSEDMPRLIPVRIFLAADVPGVNAAAGAFSNGVNFTFNGVRP